MTSFRFFTYGICILVFIGCGVQKNTNAEQSSLGSNHFETEDIKNIKDGILLIKLNDQHKKIAYLEKSSNEQRLSKVKEETAAFNESIQSYFNQYYNFSEFAFFYSSDSEAIIKNQDYTSVFKTDNNSIEVPQGSKYICVYGEHPDSNRRPLEGISIMKIVDIEGRKKLVQIGSPFPSFVAASHKIDLKDSNKKWDKAIIKMNGKLKAFFISSFPR